MRIRITIMASYITNANGNFDLPRRADSNSAGSQGFGRCRNVRSRASWNWGISCDVTTLKDEALGRKGREKELNPPSLYIDDWKEDISWYGYN